jgi:hypothetical protein
VPQELADIAIFLFSLAEMTGTDLQDWVRPNSPPIRPGCTSSSGTAFTLKKHDQLLEITP